MDQNNFEVKTNLSPINLLPDEMLLKIFSYFQVVDICRSVSTVCQRWNALCTANELWKSKWLKCGNFVTYNVIKSTLRDLPLLQAIELQWRTDVDLIVEVLNKCCENIHQIHFVCCGKLKSETVTNLVSSYPLLHDFSMEKCWRVQDSCYSIIPNFKHLRSLNISHAKHLSRKTMKDIVDFCPFLVDLNIDYVRGISDNEVLYLIDKKGSILLSLVIYGECLTDSSFCCLDKCLNLRKLHISRCDNMTNLALVCIGKLTKLNSLKLRFGVKISSEDLNRFLESEAVSNLNYLCWSLSQNFTDDSAAVIGRNCKKLTQLDVMHCPNLSELGCQIVKTNCVLLHTLNLAGGDSFGGELNDLLISFSKD